MKKEYIHHPVIVKAKGDYGTFKHFCLKKGLNVNTARHVINGYGVSAKVTNILIECGYIGSADELKRVAV